MQGSRGRDTAMPLLRCVVSVVMVLAAPARAGGDFPL
jgi:hypothetical protein